MSEEEVAEGIHEPGDERHRDEQRRQRSVLRVSCRKKCPTEFGKEAHGPSVIAPSPSVRDRTVVAHQRQRCFLTATRDRCSTTAVGRCFATPGGGATCGVR